jgi:hypothetical protein
MQHLWVGRVQNKALFKKYALARQLLRESRGRQAPLSPSLTAAYSSYAPLSLPPPGLGLGDEERLLFHGCGSQHPRVLCQKGFNIMYADSGFYGKGLYFAESATYSNSGFASCFAGSVNVESTLGSTAEEPTPSVGASPARCSEWLVLLLASVVSGRQHEMAVNKDQSLRCPPPGFHSVAGGPHRTRDGVSGRMLVIYNDSHAYPRYVVAYRPSAVLGKK